jgi:hypothetical protein
VPCPFSAQVKRSLHVQTVMGLTLGIHSRASSQSSIYILSPSSQLLHYETSATFPRKPRARFPREMLDNTRDVLIRSDLESIGVDVCSIEVRTLQHEVIFSKIFLAERAGFFLQNRSHRSSPRTLITKRSDLTL